MVKWIRENLVLVLDHPIISWVSKKYITFEDSDNLSRPHGKASAKIPVSVISPACGIDLGINVYTSMTDRSSNQIEMAPSFWYRITRSTAMQLLTTERNLLSSPVPSTWHTVRTHHWLKKKTIAAEKECSLCNKRDSNVNSLSVDIFLVIQVPLSFPHSLLYTMSASQQLQDQCVKCLKGCRSSNRIELALKCWNIKVRMCSFWS